jgi:hypothetical protein
MKAKLVNEYMEPQRMTPEAFAAWFYSIYEDHPEVDWEAVLSSLMNDENSSYDEMHDYFIDEFDLSDDLTIALLDKQEYFLDFRYAQLIQI